MSQRLLICKRENITPEDDIYDCIYTENSNLENLLSEWCLYKNGLYFGPWKITIRDDEFIDRFYEDFKKIGNFIPELKSFDDVWAIYDKNGKKIHLKVD